MKWIGRSYDKKFCYVSWSKFPEKNNKDLLLCKEDKIMGAVYEEASDYLGIDVISDCVNGVGMDDIETISLYTVVNQIALFKKIMNCNEELEIEYLAGHSLGEYSALICSGYMGMKEGLHLVRKRAILGRELKENSHTTMILAFNIDTKQLERIINNLKASGCYVWISCYNSKRQCSVVGKEEDIKIFESEVYRMGGMTQRLLYNPPFHSPFMKKIENAFKIELENETFIKEGKYKVISGCYGKVYNKENLVENLVAQLVEPVRWNQVIAKIDKSQIQHCIEIGGSMLSNFVKEDSENMEVLCIKSLSDV